MADNATLYVMIVPDAFWCVKAERPAASVRELEYGPSGGKGQRLGARSQLVEGPTNTDP
jgi:hypothetical protein